MATTEPTNFLAGVIEGFYGPPWSQAERFELLGWMHQWGLNTYMYAPKDDLKHRARWREVYTEAEAKTLHDLIQRCGKHAVRFLYALSPGLDIRYSDAAELKRLQARFEQMIALGCRHFALLFDDIPDRMAAEDAQRWTSFAAAQAHVTNAMFTWTRARCPEARFLFCPTPYCGRMALREYGGAGYLDTLGRELHAEIDVFWTGPEIISREIPVAHVEELRVRLRRAPVIWDNLHANDYDGRRFFCGPYSGRAPEVRAHVRGLLVNPNNEFPLNFVPLRTLAEFVRCRDPWNPRQAYLDALREWLPRFTALGQPAALDELVLFGDCFYLPHEDGAEAGGFCRDLEHLLARPPKDWGDAASAWRQRAVRLRDFCARLATLEDRPLFYALHRRVWELREELDLLEKFVEFKSKPENAAAPFRSDFHLPGTYRGGLVPRLQRLLRQLPDESLVPDAAPATGNNPQEPA